MPKVNSFTDHNGKKGKVGSLVYPWMIDIVVNDEERLALPTVRANKARMVESIITQGAAGSQIKLVGDWFYSPAKTYTILKEV